MKYRTGAAFQQALAGHIVAESRRSGHSAERLWRRVAFDRLLARLVAVASGQWILKGGLALDFRLGERARTTQDIDLAWCTDLDAAEATLQTAAQLDLGDYFTFEIERTDVLDDADVGGALRYAVTCNLAGRRGNGFKLDIGVGSPLLVGEPDMVVSLNLLDFAGIEPFRVLAVPVAQHVAEKVHAYCRTYGPENRPSSRERDLVDMVLIQAHERVAAADLRTALETVFTVRGDSPLPPRLPQPPNAWRIPYRRMATALGIPADLDGGYRLADVFLRPVLDGTIQSGHVWEPGSGWWPAQP